MSEDCRQRRIMIAAVFVTLLFHGALLAGLALAEEWRVLRFLANAVAQLDVALMLCWVVWEAVTVPSKWPIVGWFAPEQPGKLYAGLLRILGHMIILSPAEGPLDFTDPRVRFETIIYRLMFLFALMTGLVALMPEGWDQIYAMLVPLAGFLGVAIAVGVPSLLRDGRTKGSIPPAVAS